MMGLRFKCTALGLTAVMVLSSLSCTPEDSHAGVLSEEPQAGSAESIWAVDLVRTLPGGQQDYIENIERNWASARDLARSGEAVLSYLALAAPQDSTRGWDVILMTEYADSSAYANREAIFEEIFQSDEFTRFVPARPSSEIREFLDSNVTLRTIADSR